LAEYYDGTKHLRGELDTMLRERTWPRQL